MSSCLLSRHGKANMKQIITYVEPAWTKEIRKKRGSRGFITNSAYLRYLIQKDIEI